MQPAGLWEEVGSLELQVTPQLVENSPATRAYRVAARLRSSRYGLLTGSGALRQDKTHPERGWTLDPLGADTGAGVQAFGRSDGQGQKGRRGEGEKGSPADSRRIVGFPLLPFSPSPLLSLTVQRPTRPFPSPQFEIAPSPGTLWDGATIAPRLVVRTWYGVPEGAPRYALEGEVTLERRPEPLPRPVPKRRVEVRVERPELPPSDLRRAIENLAPLGSPEAAAPLPPLAEETAVQVRVTNAAGQPVAGERIRVRISPAPDSGGHAGVHSGPRPHGWLLPVSAIAARPGGPRIGSLEPEWLGTTDAAGELRLRYRAPELAGVETLSAELAHDPETRAFVELRVGLPLVALPPNPDYFLVGGTLAHPSADNDAGTSHFVAAAVLPKLAAAAAEFRRATGLPLRVNDSSLPWGGLFDIDGGWERPHYNHRDGTDIDLAVFGYPGAGTRMVGPAPDLLFRAPVSGPLAAPLLPGVRGLAMSEIELLAGAVRRHGGRPGFEGDHIHASFGPIRFAEGPPRPTPAAPGEELAHELKALLDSLEMLPDEPTAPAPPASKAAPSAGRQPATAPASSANGVSKPEAAPVKANDAHLPAPAGKPDAKVTPPVTAAPEPAPLKDPANAPPPAAAPAKLPPRPDPPAFDPTAPLAPPAAPPSAAKPAPKEEKESKP
jgi:hypothetical protein